MIGVLVGVPLGAWLALTRHRLRNLVDVLVNAGMGIPPVLAGLLILILLWNDGPLGSLELLFTPTAMIGAQALLAIPIAAGITAGAIRGLGPAANEQLFALRLSGRRAGYVAGREALPGVIAAIAAAFGRLDERSPRWAPSSSSVATSRERRRCSRPPSFSRPARLTSTRLWLWEWCC